jgi:hypothetical protein
MVNFAQAAADLIGRGFSIIPIEPQGKRPVRGLGATNRTRDLAVAEGWARQYPGANIAVCADDNIVLLETDDYERFSQTVKNGTGESFPLTLMACGSSEGRPHFFFKRTEKSTNVGNLVVPGLFEARFNNQYLVAVPSVHPSGAVYRFLNDAPMVPIPDWLVSELARLALTQKNSTPARQVEMSAGRVPEGSRHYFLMREIGRLWDGQASEDELLEKAHELNGLCDPPKDEAHVRQCVRDIMRREPYNAGPKVLIGSGRAEVSNASVGLDSGGVQATTVSGKPPSAQIWQPVTAFALQQMDLPARQVILAENDSPLFYESSINQILAWRGVGKTNFALGLANAMASGGRILDFQADRPRPVLYLDGELPLSLLRERVVALTDEKARRLISLFSPELKDPKASINLVSQKDCDALERVLDTLKPEVLFIDSQSTTMMGDANTSNDFQEQRNNVLMQLRLRGLCIIEMHHVGKEGRQRGLSKNDDLLDVQMHLKKLPEWEPEDGLCFQVVYEKVRHASHLESGYVVGLEGGKWVKRVADAVQQYAKLHNQNASLKDMMKALKVSRATVYRMQKKALSAGLIESAVDLEIGNMRVKRRGVPA